MKEKNKVFSLFLAAALLFTSVFQVPLCSEAKESMKNTKYYTISQKAGTYTAAIKVKVKVKKGYRVYYKTSGKFKKTKVIQSGKSKTFTIRKTTLLSLCAVKKSKKVTNRKLNQGFKKNKSAYYGKYKYIISKSNNTETSEVTESPTVAESAAASPQSSTSPEDVPTPPEGTPPSGSIPPMGTPPFQNETPEGSSSPGMTTADPEGRSDAQNKIDEAESQIAAGSSEPAVTKEPSAVEEQTPAVALTSEGISMENIENDAIAYTEEGELKILTINQAGTYLLSGGTVSEPITNTEIVVAGNISDEVNLIWDNLVIDNQALGTNEGEDVPVFRVNKSTSNVHITLKGSSVFTGNGTYTESPAAAVICADYAGTTLTFSAYEGDDTASLTVVDAMDTDTDFGENDPSDGIYCKGTLVLDGGIYSVTVNGDCLKGTGKSGEGGIVIHGGVYTLRSEQSNALKSKNGNIVIHGGTLQSVYTADDAINAKNYDVMITGGSIDIDQCYGDGIQGENINISGEDTVINIQTYFENAGINYYSSSLGSGNYNILTSTDTTKTEVVNVDTGSHKGIKGGTKAHTYSYKSVEDGSDNVAGTTYTTEASGGIVISGGTITIDTTNAGIKYNRGSDEQCILGAPDDGIHSNNTCVIAGGTLKILSSDDGITGPAGILIMNDCDITISKCYEGIEGGEIIIGSSEGADCEPAIKIYSDDDGVNAASKSTVNYVYEDESEEKYTKTETASSDNTLKVLCGYLNVMIADDETHNFSLSNEDGTKTTGNYNSDGDGIDCNGSFYAYGGTIVVFGANSDGNAPIDTDSGYYIGSGVTLLAVGKSGMAESPALKEQAVLVYGSSGSDSPGSGGFGSMRPGPGGNQGSSSSFSANTVFSIMKDDNVLLAIKPIKDYNYILYSSPELENGSAYTLYSGGSASGSLVQADSSAYDYRYTGYDAAGATVLSTVTLQN